MAKYLCLKSFAGIGFTGRKGGEIDLDDKAVIASLISDGYIKAAEAEVVAKPATPAKKKTTTRKKATKKEG